MYIKNTKLWPDISIIIPCYNEYENLGKLLLEIIPLINDYNLEFILVENGSKDQSRDYFKEHIENKFERIKTLYIDVNQGYGYGIKQGILQAVGKYVCWIHADMQVPVSELRKFLDHISVSASGVFFKAHRTNRSFIENFFTTGQALFSSLLFHTVLKDVAAVPMMLPKDFLSENFKYLPNDFAIDIYLYVKAVKSGLLCVWYPVKLQPRMAGDSSWNHGLASRIKLSITTIRNSYRIKKMLKANA